MIQVVIKRKIFTQKSTIGELYINGEFICYTLEDCYRPDEQKVPGETCIPYGIYEVIFSYSGKFKRSMPFIVGVKNFEGVMFHWGNFPHDTRGCILLGFEYDTDRLISSYAAYSLFWIAINKNVPVYLTITVG